MVEVWHRSIPRTLFGDEFQETFTKKVEKDLALSKAVSITRRNTSHREASSPGQDGRGENQFFRGSPPARYGDRRGRSFFPYNTTGSDPEVPVPQTQVPSTGNPILRAIAQSLKRESLNQGKTSLRQLSSLLGTVVAAHPAVLPAPLHYRHLERAKIHATRRGFSYEAEVRLWVTNISCYKGRPL